MLWAQSTTKDYIRAEHKLHSICKLFISQVMLLFFWQIYIPQVLNTGTCIQQGDLFYSGTSVSHSQHRKKIGRCLEKVQVNGPEGYSKYIWKWVRWKNYHAFVFVEKKERVMGGRLSDRAWRVLVQCQGESWRKMEWKTWRSERLISWKLPCLYGKSLLVFFCCENLYQDKRPIALSQKSITL